MSIGRTIVVALGRVGRGIFGGWCVVGPLLLIFAQRELLDHSAFTAFAVLVLSCYAIVVWQCWRHGLSSIGHIALDTALIAFFVAVGGAIIGSVSAMGGPALRQMGPTYVIFPALGFWILEMRRRKHSADVSPDDATQA